MTRQPIANLPVRPAVSAVGRPNVDKWPLTVDKWPVCSDKWPVCIDKWPLAPSGQLTDKWPLI